MDLPHTPLPPVQEILKPALHRILNLSSDSNEKIHAYKYKQTNHLEYQNPAALEDSEDDNDNNDKLHLHRNHQIEIQDEMGYPPTTHLKDNSDTSKLTSMDSLQDAGSYINMSSECSKTSLEERVSTLELHLKCRCTDISKEIKLVQAELNIITDWIHSKFDTSLIDKTSVLYRSLHKDMREVEEISKSLLMMSKLPSKSRVTGNRRKSGSSKGGSRSGGSQSAKKLKSSQSKLMFRGVLGTWIESSVCVPSKINSKTSKESLDMSVEEGLAEIKEEQDEFLAHDPFEDGYIPEVDEEGNVDTMISEEQPNEGSRPKRSSTRNVSYDGFLESEEEESPEPPKRGKGSPRKKREKGFPSLSEDNSDQIQDAKSSNSKKKYKPSEASTMRAKILANTPMMCDECGKVVKGPWTLKAHKEMHANIRRYTCHVCGYAFRRKPHLNAHLLLHEGVKHLKCQYCGRGFYLRRDLARHERTHTGEKPYNCTFPNCTKSFNVKQHLTMHYRTHTGERPYKCTICEKSFSQANTLRIHKKLHEGGTSPTSSRRKPRVSKANRAAINTAEQSSSHPSSTSVHPMVLPPQSSTESHLMEPSSPSTSSNSTPTANNPFGPQSSSGGTRDQQPDFRSPPPPESSSGHPIQQQPGDTLSRFPPDARQAIHNVVISNSSSAHPFEIINHSWRQGIAGQAASTLSGNHTTGLFLPQIYEPLNMHFSSYPPPNSN